MGDSPPSRSRLWDDEDEDENYECERLLYSQDLILDDDSIEWILKHIDCFVRHSRGNESVEELYLWPDAYLHPYDFSKHDDDAWAKFGQAIGNLRGLGRFHMRPPNYQDDDEVIALSDWKILALILTHVRQNIALIVTPTYDEDEDDDEADVSAWLAEEVQPIARAIRGHPTMTSFYDNGKFPYESLDTLYSALATLPALESITLGAPEERRAGETTLVNPESLTELLRVPTLRFVRFDNFSFTSALCQATANALMEGMAVTKLEFTQCSFSAEGSAIMMANGLSRNTSVSHITVVSPRDQALYDALATALPSNSTLRDLSFCGFITTRVRLSPVFVAMGKNMGLKSLRVDWYSSMDEALCTAMQNGLGINETLEILEINRLTDYNATLCCRALSFLRTNTALKSLIIRWKDVTESCLSAFRIDIVAMLQENTSLESLTFRSWNGIEIKAEEYFKLVTALQHNATLKTLSLYYPDGLLQLNDDESKQMTALLKKNYAMEKLLDISPGGNVGAILRLNEAGRRYLVQDGSSISKGVEVLIRVNNIYDNNCVFLHLLENPRLCDRSAVEMITAGESYPSRSTNQNASSGGGKREQASAHKGKESRRRLA
jgi:hypothetical protein